MQEPFPTSASGRSPLEVAVRAAQEAGRLVMDFFPRAKQVTFKGRANVVTDVDVLSEKVVLRLLREEYPDHSIMAEESEAITRDSPYTWVVDPLDGTRNYASGVPHFAVVVALAFRGRVVVGVTYDPLREELFAAQEGGGASLNGRPIHVSPRKELAECLLGLDMGYVGEKALRALKLVQALWPGMQSIRIMGSSALGLAYAACGRVDLYFHHQLYPWDIASGLLLVREAGGVVKDRHGRPAALESESIIASSPHLVDRFLQATEGLEWRR